MHNMYVYYSARTEMDIIMVPVVWQKPDLGLSYRSRTVSFKGFRGFSISYHQHYAFYIFQIIFFWSGESLVLFSELNKLLLKSLQIFAFNRSKYKTSSNHLDLSLCPVINCQKILQEETENNVIMLCNDCSMYLIIFSTGC